MWVRAVGTPYRQLDFLGVGMNVVTVTVADERANVSEGTSYLPAMEIPPSGGTRVKEVEIGSVVFTPVVLPVRDSSYFLTATMEIIADSNGSIPVTVVMAPVVTSSAPG